MKREKIVQTAGRDSLGSFAPDFARYNDDILFGEVWNNDSIDLKTKSTIVISVFMGRAFSDAGKEGNGSCGRCSHKVLSGPDH
jgi:4-carboxymuconolactone decarboxylase